MPGAPTSGAPTPAEAFAGYLDRRAADGWSSDPLLQAWVRGGKPNARMLA